MNERSNTSRVMHACVGALALACAAASVSAQDAAEKVVAAGEARNTAAAASQARIDKVADQTGDLVSKYKSEMKVVDGLQVYNQLLQKQLDGQQQEIADLSESIDKVSIIERQIVPLMIKMLDGLEQFVELDVPFLLEERRERIAKLKNVMEQPDVTSAEKFRLVMEAYEIETDFGRTIESYRGGLEIDGRDWSVNFLRIGRIALLYQSDNGELNGAWNQQTRAWESLKPEEYKNNILNGLKIARKQVAPDLLMVPVMSTGGAQ